MGIQRSPKSQPSTTIANGRTIVVHQRWPSVKFEEDLVDQLQAKHKVPPFLSKGGQGPLGKMNPQWGGNYKFVAIVTQFTLLKVGRSQILREVYHTRLLDIPLPIKRQLGLTKNEWREFHHAHRHTMKNCRTLKSQFKKLIREGHLTCFMQT
ncbi:hypothetical protein CR513_24940, partial [Mucuna pruriens]